MYTRMRSLQIFTKPNQLFVNTPGLSGFWDQSQANSALYSAFWSVEPTNFKNVIFENIHWALFEVAEVEVVWPRRPWRPQKEPSECFQKLHFWNQWVLLIKMHCRVHYLLDSDLKTRSGQVQIQYSWVRNFIIHLTLRNTHLDYFFSNLRFCWGWTSICTTIKPFN